MSKVDDELTRRLRRAERPVDGDALFEGLARRRSHRERVRKVQAGLLAFAVLAATAGGFVALRQVFDSGQRDTGGAPLSANGEIVFSREGDDGRLHLFASEPDGTGVRQITDAPTNDTDPTVSPDGTTIAYVRASDEYGRAIATVPLEGGSVTELADGIFVDDPAWSPDGTEVAFVTSGIDSVLLGIVNRNGRLSRSLLDVATSIASPSWSPDGSRIAIGVVPEGSRGSVGIISSDTGAENPLETTLGVGWAPAWSPDGTKVALIRAGDDSDEIWTVAPDGSDEMLVATAVEASLEPDLAWAPDGSALLVSDGEWIYRADATPEGDPRSNFVQLVRGVSPSWQPLPAGSEPEPSPTSEPTVSPSAEPEGRDIGLGFDVCNLERLGGIAFLGEGTQGQAWTAAKVNDNGTCPGPSLGHAYLVAVDVDGDGVADASSQTVEFCFFCRPFDAVDFDVDGDDELVVMASEGSTPTFMVYDVHGTDGARRVDPVLVAEPGHREAGEEPGEPLTFSTGGDEGYSGWVRCEDFPAAPVLVITWRDAPIDGDTMEVHETRFVLEDDGMFHVVGSNDYSAPVADAIPGASDAPACGVDWQIWD